MKNIYLFQYQFKQDKRGLLNYSTFIIDEDFDKATEKFFKYFPHVPIDSVKAELFRGDMIDKCEPAE